jgi:hypothetical protein
MRPVLAHGIGALMRMLSTARCGRVCSLRSLVRLFLVTSALVSCFSAHGTQHVENAFEQRHAHEHGKVSLNIVVDRNSLVVELDAPAANVVGFEHAPRNATERSAVSAAIAMIRGGRALFGTPEAAKCRFVSAEFAEPAATPDEDDHSGTHAAGAEEHGHEQHSNYEPKFTYECAHPEQLAWIEPWIVSKLLKVTEVRVNLITPTGQRSETAKNAHVRIGLR